MSIAPTLIYRAATLVRGEHGLFRYLKELRDVQTLSIGDVAKRQEDRLRWMLEFASRNVSHYRGLFDKDVLSSKPARSALLEWPLLEKSVLQTHPQRLRSPYAGRVAVKSTGGSTGAPVEIIKDADGMARERAATWMALKWFGIGIGDRAVRFWGTPLNSRKRRAYWLADVAMNRRRLSAFEIEGEDFERHWSSLIRYRPVWLYGYSTAIHMFARWIEDRGKPGRELGVRLVVPTAEPITPDMEADIERVFGAPVQVEYGCGEVGAIAYSCKEGNLHLMTENVFVEILREDGTPADVGEQGEVVITDLTNRAMPLIRYRLGDRSSLLPPCVCDLPFPTMDRVQGRARDVIITPKGRRVYGGLISYHMTALARSGSGFRQYQFIQTDEHSVEVRLIVDQEISPALAHSIERFVNENLDGMRVSVRRVDRIERARSGKLRLVQNRLLDTTDPLDLNLPRSPVA